MGGLDHKSLVLEALYEGPEGLCARGRPPWCLEPLCMRIYVFRSRPIHSQMSVIKLFQLDD